MRTMSTHTKPSQSGVVAIMVTLVMMLVISLIVLGFSEVSRREQRQSLDRQLSTQAFLAAESGVNDASEVIRQAIRNGDPIPQKGSCDNTGPEVGNLASLNPVIDAGNEVSYTCLMVDTSVETVVTEVGGGVGGVTIPINPESSPIDTLTFKWSGSETATNADCDSTVPVTGAFPAASDWQCDYGVLRVDVVPTDASQLNRTALLDNQKAFYFYPTRATGGGAPPTLSYGAATTRGATSAMACRTSTGDCQVNLTGLGGSSTYALRVTSIYVPGTVSIAAKRAGAGINLMGTQALIDVTGKARDVLRRIQVRLSLVDANGSSGYAVLSGGSICKRFAFSDTNFNIPDNLLKDDTTNPMCAPVNIGNPPPVACHIQAEIMFVLDASGSMQDEWESGTRFKKLKAVARGMVQDITLSDTGIRIGIISFSEGNTLEQILSSNRGQIISSINTMKTGINTYYGQALDASVAHLNSRSRPGANQVVVFMSDGRNDDPDSSIISRTKTMKSNGIRIYTVGITDEAKDVDTLKKMYGNGGRYAHASSESDLDGIADSIVADYSCP